MTVEVMTITDGTQTQLFNLADYDDNSIGQYDWENSASDRVPPRNPKAVRERFKNLLPIPDNPTAPTCPDLLPKIPDLDSSQQKFLLESPATFREQPENLLPKIPNLDSSQQKFLLNEPPTFREQPRNLLPKTQPPDSNNFREQPKNLLPKTDDLGSSEIREQVIDDQPKSGMLVPIGHQINVKGVTYILIHSRSGTRVPTSSGWFDIKTDKSKKNLYLCLRWREGTKQRSHHLGKVIRADSRV